mgnify:CR=1 FL=1
MAILVAHRVIGACINRRFEERVLLARKLLKGSNLRSFTNCYHVWLELPPGAEAVPWQKKLTCRRTQWQEAKGTQEVHVPAA